MLTLRISPCPNDTFIFHAMLHSLVDTEGLAFEVEFHDIETLNEMATRGEADVVKASVAVADRIPYTMLDSGAALGYGNGPILVGRGTGDALVRPAPLSTIAIPGANTTAALLFRRYFPEHTNLRPMPFNTIASAVKNGQVDMGVLIHEGRFTYAELGLEKIADLGELWQNEMQMPIPLGAIYAKNTLGEPTIKKVERIICRSTLYAMQNGEASACFVRAHAQELAPHVLKNHIDYFVNDFTLSLGAKGRQSIATLLQRPIQEP